MFNATRRTDRASLLRVLGCLLVLLAGVLHASSLAAQPAAAEIDATSLTRELDQIEHALKRNVYHRHQLDAWLKQSQAAKQAANNCITLTQNNLSKAQADLTTLGPAIKGEAAAVVRQRWALERQASTSKKRLASCKLLLLRGEDIASKITAARQQLLAERLLARGPTVLNLIGEYWDQYAHWWNAARSVLVDNTGVQYLSPTHLQVLLAVAGISLLIGVALRRRIAGSVIRSRALEKKLPENFAGKLGLSLVTVFGHYLPHLLVTSSIAVFFYVITSNFERVPLVSIVAYGLPAYFFLVALIHLFLDPMPPATPIHSLPKEVARSLGRRLQVLVLLIFIGYLLFSTLLMHGMPSAALLLVRGLFATVLILDLIWIVWLVGRIPRFADTLGLRTGSALVLTGSLIAEWLGYRNISVFTLRGVLGTLLALGATVLVNRLVREMFDGLESTRHNWQRWLRNEVGLKAQDRIPGLAWLRFITFIALWLIFIVATLQLWGLSDTGFQQLLSFVEQGFAVGSLNIVPTKIVLAVIAFIVLTTVSSWFKNRLAREWLPKMRLERGALEAMVTISGYVGIGIALLVALGIAGVEFGNLAIIAGALSVGIGFGLQNIVNNFISGLILLFERPIKTGDWIVVGNTEGYVKRISIRSTQIQTFDRADVIVPNSELISGQVTNWMLYDPRGRVRVPIGVAYGSDTKLVKNILLGIASDHPLVVKDKDVPEPAVLFLGFGDSALNFELRCFIRNIDRRLTVISDLNFAIDAAFREHGIEIPFPQRDLHVRGWPREGSGDPATRPDKGEK